MKYEETGSQDSFTLWGSGFQYEYMASENALNIKDPLNKRALARLKFDSYISKDPFGYVQFLDKANQIKALNLSNDRTINLLDIIDEGRVAPILNSTASASYSAQMLISSNFGRFSDLFVKDTVLQNIAIKKFSARTNQNCFYVARAQTVNQNAVSVRGCNMAALLAALSEKTLRDLITLEFGDKFQNTAHELLRIATKLSSIGAILDSEFIPENRLRKPRNKLGKNTFARAAGMPF